MKKYSKALLKKLYSMMVKIRLCEESFVEPIIRGEIRCPVHLYSGQEAVATGVCAALTERDYIFGTHRSHGHYIAKGGGLKELVAEIYCRETGCSKGRGGSMHVLDPDRGMIGSAPIVAGTISLGLGASLASSIRKEKRVTVSFFGDGATGEGVLYESLNFASLRKLPVIFACENNLYSTHMPIRDCRPNQRIADIGKPFGMVSMRVNGNNVLQVYESSGEAVKLCRDGKGPIFMEFVTYRLRGHVGPDDNIQGTHTDIRPQEEIERWERKDPIKSFANFVLKNNLLKKKDLERIEGKIKIEVEEAHLFAKQSPYPKKEELDWYVFR